jgi:tetratricopeptide (TPR) repeat protein
MAPGTIETHRARGLVLEYTGNYQEAVTEFEAAIAINPNIADLHLALGRNYYYLQEYDQAITEYTKANALNPKDSTPESLIASVYLINGDYTKAAQYAEAALQDKPTDPYLYGNLGLIYWRQQYYQDSVDVLKIAVQGGTTSDGQTIKGLSMDYGKAGTFDYTRLALPSWTVQSGLPIARQSRPECAMMNCVLQRAGDHQIHVNLGKQGSTEVPAPTGWLYYSTYINPREATPETPA